MIKYIDKDKVLEYIIFGVVGKDITCGELTRAIENIPAVDIVPCGMCGNNKRNTDGVDEDWCLKFGYEIESDDWCSYGESLMCDDIECNNYCPNCGAKMKGADKCRLTADKRAQGTKDI